MRFLVDADLPRSTAKIIRSLGFEVFDVRDVGLRYAEDSEILDYANKNSLIVLTKDFDFIGLARFSTHKGIIHVRLPHYFDSEKLNFYVKEFFKSVKVEELAGAISVLELNRFRIQK